MATAPPVCRFGVDCSRGDCWFSHPGRAATPGTVPPGGANRGGSRGSSGRGRGSRGSTPTRGAGDGTKAPPVCRFGVGCSRGDCWFSHPGRAAALVPCSAQAPQPEPQVAAAATSEMAASDTARQERTAAMQGSNKTADQSAEIAPKVCRFGSACTRAGCRFAHLDGQVVGAASPGAAISSLLPAPTGPVCCIDVECVATGTTHHDREVAQIALVEYSLNVLGDLYVIPSKPIVSYITPLTVRCAANRPAPRCSAMLSLPVRCTTQGCDEATLQAKGAPLEVALTVLRAALPSNCTLIGHNIG